MDRVIGMNQYFWICLREVTNQLRLIFFYSWVSKQLENQIVNLGGGTLPAGKRSGASVVVAESRWGNIVTPVGGSFGSTMIPVFYARHFERDEHRDLFENYIDLAQVNVMRWLIYWLQKTKPWSSSIASFKNLMSPLQNGLTSEHLIREVSRLLPRMTL